MSKASEYFTVKRCKELADGLKSHIGMALTGKQMQEVIMTRGEGGMRRDLMRSGYKNLKSLDTYDREGMMYLIQRFLLGEKMYKRFVWDAIMENGDEKADVTLLLMMKAKQRGWKLTPECEKGLQEFIDSTEKFNVYCPDNTLTNEELAQRVLMIRLDDRYQRFMLAEQIRQGLLTEASLKRVSLIVTNWKGLNND